MSDFIWYGGHLLAMVACVLAAVAGTLAACVSAPAYVVAPVALLLACAAVAGQQYLTLRMMRIV